MERDDDAKETWFQHVYDYFAGKTRIENFEKKSNGMIYNNFAQFMRLVSGFCLLL